MGSFSKKISSFAKQAKVAVEDDIRAAAFELFRSVISDTPVDSGRLKGNWVASSESPTFVQLENVRTEEKTISDALPIISSFRLDGVIYLTNSLPYANRIEYEGWSQKAPDGMVRKNVQRVAANLKSGSK